MKIKHFALATGLLAGSAALYSCQNNNANAQNPSAAAAAAAIPEGTLSDRFSYSYGALVGNQFRSMGLTEKDLNTNDFLLGLTDAMNGKELQVDLKTAEQEVGNKMQGLQQAKAKEAEGAGKAFLAENAKKKGVVTLPSGLQYEVITEGKGAKPKLTDKVKVHYHGTLIDGKVFDSSVQRGEPISFPLNGVIKGWQEGVALMSVGAKYKLYIPHELGYGSQAAGSIPPYSTLIFEVELLGINQ